MTTNTSQAPLADARLPFAASDDDSAEIWLVDRAVARAYWEGVSAARLLARVRLHRDAEDLALRQSEPSTTSSWDVVLARLTAASTAHDRIKKSIARHTRNASDEGPLAASDASITALVHAYLSSGDADASPGEGVGVASPLDSAIERACTRMDARLGTADRRAPVFEACLELTVRGATSTSTVGTFRRALAAVGATDLASEAPLYPVSGEAEVPIADRRICLLARPVLERALLRPPHEIAADLSRAGDLGTTATEIAALVGKRGDLVLVVAREAGSQREPPELPKNSWLPPEIGTNDGAATLASALERGATTAPRVRALVLRGGDAALAAASEEMLAVAAHPFASSVLAEIVATAGRERDALRLLTYFAIAPDPTPAAYALSICSAPELPALLRAFLESMLPADGQAAPPGDDPDTSTRARLASCVSALRPYPRLFAVVEPLLPRFSDLPPLG